MSKAERFLVKDGSNKAKRIIFNQFNIHDANGADTTTTLEITKQRHISQPY